MTIEIRPTSTDLVAIAEAGPAVPELDTALVEVSGGLLTWSVLDLAAAPIAIIDDVARAQDWVWAIYGSDAARALDAGQDVASFAPDRPEAVDDAALLAYALWAQRWWPVSAIDMIPALDESLLAEDIAGLQAECDGLLEDAGQLAASQSAPASQREYALAAGGPAAGELVLAHGAGGTDWRAYPPGLIDAAEEAVSWSLVRAGGHTLLRLEVAAAPGLSGPVPAHLRPVAHISSGATLVELDLNGDRWTGHAAVADSYEPIVAVYVPGFGDARLGDPGAGLELREQIRQLIRRRLAGAGAAEPGHLLAEIHAATSDLDY